MEAFLKKYDTLLIGILLATVLPIITYLICYTAKSSYMDIGEFTAQVFNNRSYRINVLTMCVLPNMFLFYFVNFRYHMGQFTKGLVIVSLLIGVAIAISAL